VLIYHRRTADGGIRLARRSRPVTSFPSLSAVVWGY
jgi:hypothetical protein